MFLYVNYCRTTGYYWGLSRTTGDLLTNSSIVPVVKKVRFLWFDCTHFEVFDVRIVENVENIEMVFFVFGGSLLFY